MTHKLALDPTSEWKLVKASLVVPERRNELRERMGDLSERMVIYHYWKEDMPYSVEQLAAIGMLSFDSALFHYTQKFIGRVPEIPEYKFSTYYSWWIKASVEDYLERKGVRLR